MTPENKIRNGAWLQVADKNRLLYADMGMGTMDSMSTQTGLPHEWSTPPGRTVSRPLEVRFPSLREELMSP
jgi:hypothetical protein